MDRKQFLGIAAAAAASVKLDAASRRSPAEARAGSPGTSAARTPFTLRGVYFHDGFTAEPKSQAPLYWGLDTWKRQLDWLKYCGINAVEYATMLEFNRIPSTDLERRKITDRLKILDHAHSIGLKFGYLLTNTVLSTVPEGEEPGHQELNRATTLCPREPGNFEKTVAIPKFYMNTYRKADFFEEFAADWGGCTCGKCDVSDFLRYVKELAAHLRELRSPANIYADTWCIAFWRKDPMADGWKGVFDQEIAGSRRVIDALKDLPSNVHLALPCHHLYRPLTFESYGGKAKTPVFPTSDDVRTVRQSGRDVLAWPHFVMDDDAYRAKSWGIVHSESRYINDLLKTLQSTGIRQVIGNLYLPHLQLSNTFCYGRFLQDPGRQPEAVLEEFAKIVAAPGDVAKLTDVLIWMDNHSYWQQQMPADGKLPSLPSRLSKAEAIRIAGGIKPNTKSAMLPIPAAEWLGHLNRSLAKMDWA
jgi:hypothetical protein